MPREQRIHLVDDLSARETIQREIEGHDTAKLFAFEFVIRRLVTFQKASSVEFPGSDFGLM